MRFSIPRVLLVSLVSAVGAPALAQEQVPELSTPPATQARPLTFGFFWENDSRLFKPNHPTDRFYTNGVAVTFAGQPEIAREINDVIPFGDRYDRFALGGIVGQLMFTPSDLERETLIRDEQPYAGYFFGGVYWQRADRTTVDHFQIDVGIVGPSSLAGETQKWFHSINDSGEPEGWDNQLHDEVTGQGYFRKKWRLRVDPDGVGLNADVIPSVGVALGTVYRWAEAGATARVGYNLPDDFGPGRLADVRAATGDPLRTQRGLGVFGFVRVAGRAVEHNMFLEGNNFRESPGEPIENLVGELQGGIGVQYHWKNVSIDLGYAQTVITPEFHEQETTHAFAGVSFAVTVLF
ncbi:MAG: lipid A deacylase LpxR family protein [Planctomycetes bacterium]|nr:lipid A deacylase LpxR family protein [Planctomycetota bacterium]